MNPVMNSSSPDPYAAINGRSSGALASKSAQDMSETFLKLLVTQMQNQDPLNPMDNAQLTSQMAQINTVSGIEKLNATMQAIAGQVSQSQSLQATALVGRDVLVEGNRLDVVDGSAQAGFDLSGPADQVKVELLSSSGRVIDTLQLGALGAGRHGFRSNVPAGALSDPDLRFRVTASAGASNVAATPLMAEQVIAVSTGGGQIQLELASGRTLPYTAVQAIS